MMGESSNPEADSNGCAGCGCLVFLIFIFVIVLLMLLDPVGRALIIGILIGWFAKRWCE